MEKTGGKRLAPDPRTAEREQPVRHTEPAPGGSRRPSKKSGSKVHVFAGILIALLALGYLGLCAVGEQDAMWRGTSVMGVDVSGLSAAQAKDKVADQMTTAWDGKTVTLRQGSADYTLEASGLLEAPNLAGDMAKAVKGGSREGSFLTAGGRYLGWMLSGQTVDIIPDLSYTKEGEARLNTLLSQITSDLGVDKNETTYVVGETDIRFTKGRTGMTVDRDGLRQSVINVLTGAESGPVEIVLAQFPPAEPDFEAIREKVCVQVADAYLDRETREIVPAVVGRDFDVEQAKAALEKTGEGMDCRIPIQVTQPAVTAEKLSETLFRDVLGETSTRVTGTAVRKENVGVAANFVNDTIIFPGEEFSFNQICSPYSVSNGYGKATAYVNGLSKDTVAGGICQVSSTIYWASLIANLKTVERYAHRYEPSYIKGGLDATVYGDYGDEGSLDFRFENDTASPIKIKAWLDKNSYLHVTIYGTDETGIKGEPYSTNRVVTAHYQTIYEPNATIPQGTTQKDPERTGYNGVSIETYQKLVDKNGKTISNELLYKTRYYVRNETVLYNPADMTLWGIDPYTGIRSSEPPATEGEGGEATGGEAAGGEAGGEVVVPPPAATPGAPGGLGTAPGATDTPVPPFQPAGGEDEPVPIPPAEMGQTPALTPPVVQTPDDVAQPAGVAVNAPGTL